MLSCFVSLVELWLLRFNVEIPFHKMMCTIAFCKWTFLNDQFDQDSSTYVHTHTHTHTQTQSYMYIFMKSMTLCQSVVKQNHGSAPLMVGSVFAGSLSRSW